MKRKTLIFFIVCWTFIIGSGIMYFTYATESEVITIENNQKSVENREKEKVTIYVPNSKLTTLEKREAEIDLAQSTKDRAIKLTEKIIEVLREEKYIKSEDITLYNVYFNDKTIYLDFSSQIKELDDNTQKSLMTIYSIVNSLTETGKFDRIKIMINGEDGTKNLGKFYKRNTGI